MSRTEKHTRLVPHTIDGETRMVTETYEVPAPPRDWDQVVLNAVTGSALLLVTVSVVWTTASVGDLLARTVVAVVAYSGAVVFDLAWIMCMAVEWLCRYDPQRAKKPRNAGHFALAAAMAAVCVHGWLEDSLPVGIASAAVSALAKGMFTVVVAHHARPLDELTRGWLVQRESEIGARLALGSRLRHLARMDSQYAALPAASPPVDDAGRDEEPAGRADGLSDTTVRTAIRTAADTIPDNTPAGIVYHLATIGIDVTEDAVRTVLGQRPDTTDTRSRRPPVRPIAPPGQSVADSVRTALASGQTDKDRAVTYVAGLHPDTPRDTIRRTFDRITGESA